MKQANAVDWHTAIAESFDAGYANKPDFLERMQVWTTFIDSYSNLEHQVLDIGCGSGIFSLYAASKNKSVIGVDASTEMIRLCNKKLQALDINNVSFLNGNILTIDELALPGADLLICSSLLEYLDDLDNGIDTLISLLKRGGILLVSLPNRRSLFRKLEPVVFKLTGKPSYYRYVKNVCFLDVFKKSLINSGLEILDQAYFSKTPLLSTVFRKVHLSAYSDNLFLVAARKP